MADKKISQLTNITGADVVDSTDELAIVDASSNETKAITREELFKSVGGATFNGNVDLTGDLTVDSTTLHVDSTNNRVGIGTTSPGRTLDVQDGSGDADIRLLATGTGSGDDSILYLNISGTTATSRVNFGDADDADRGRIIYSHSSDYMSFTTSATEQMRIDSSGVDVTGDLDVGGSASIVSADPYIKLTDTSTGADHEIDANSGVGNLVINADINAEGSSPKILLKVTGTTGITVRDTGNVDIAGALSKGSGSFKIDHPLKPETHHLVHSFVEAPQADNIYRGKVALVDGSATVDLDNAGRMTEGTFVLLNANIQCFTSNEDGWTSIKGSVSGNTLTIQAQDASCTDTVSWLVIGERHDQHMIDTGWTDAAGRVITEPEKQPEGEEEE